MRQTNPHPLKMEMRPELELVVCYAHAHSGSANQDRIREILLAGVNWSEVAATSLQHRLVSTVFQGLTSIAEDLVPPIHREVLRSLAQDLGCNALTMFRELLRLYEMFEAERIPVFPFKGPVLSWLAYRSLTRREFVDLDFLTPHEHIFHIAALLQNAGYTPEFDLVEAQPGRAGYAPGQYSFYRAAEGLRVEIHTERTLRYFSVPLDFAELSRRQITVELAGRNLRTFSVEDTLVMLCVHAAKHFWERLNWVADIAELIHAQPVDWPLTLRVAQKMKSKRLLLLGLYLAHGILDAPMPAEPWEQADRDAKVRKLACAVCNQFVGKADPSTGVLPRAAFRIRSADTLGAGIRQLLRLTTLPTETDRESIRLPRILAPFYALTRPWRLIREYGIGLRSRAKPDLAIFEPTPAEVVDQMLRLADVAPGDVLYDLGCGEGAIVIAAAEKYGVRAVGVDINPERIAKAQANASRHRVRDRVELRVQDAKQMDVSEATVVTIFLGADGNLRLVDRLRAQLRPGARVVSRDFQIFGWTAERVETYELPRGRSRNLYLWRIPETSKSDSPAQAARTAVSEP